jgi:voltage-gated potassium channel
MKSITTQLLLFLHQRPAKRNIRLLGRFLLVLAGLVTIYSVTFHFLMAYEGQRHTWMTGFYWTLVVMSTLGFGDITFTSDIGRAFSMLVLLSGIMFLLVLLPFTFIQFFYAPWMAAQSAARAPRELLPTMRGHVILTHYDPVTTALIARLRQYGYRYVLVVTEVAEALRLHDLGLAVMVGDLDSPDTYRLCRASQAALLTTTDIDTVNTNVIFTVREAAAQVPVITTASSSASAEILRLAGADHVLQLDQVLGEALARRTIGGDAVTHVIGQVDRLLIAEAVATRTPLVGRTIRENRLTDLGVTVIGVWDRGRFQAATPDTFIGPNTVLVLAGAQEQLHSYDEAFVIYNVSTAPVVLIGGGRVGQATARALRARHIDYRIIEQNPAVVLEPEVTIVGDAAEMGVLEKAGIREAPAVIITTRDDNTNIYLSILLRHLRPDIEIIARCTLERNVPTLHRAGADFALSMASMGATMIMNLLKRTNILMVAEGLNIVSMPIPPTLAGLTLAESGVREKTGCTILAVRTDGQTRTNPNPREPLPAEGEILIIGTLEAEERFLELYGAPKG